MNHTATQSQLDAIFAALAHAKRRSIVHDLSLHPATIAQLATRHQISLPAIHKHIRILKESGLIIHKKSGRTNFVALNPHALALVQAWAAQYHTEWGDPHASLDNYIAKMRE